MTSPFKITHSVNLGTRSHVLVLTKDDPDKAELIAANAYAPNGFDEDKLAFFEELTETIAEVSLTYNCSNVILGGDLNLVFKTSEVKNRLISVQEQRTATSVKSMIEDLNLVDGWEAVLEKSFTWTSNRTGQQSFSTLDRILFATNNLKLENNVSDWSFSVSDHAAVIATFSKTSVKSSRSPLISRLDARLLQDQEGRLILEDEYRRLTEQDDANWDPHTRLEYFKMCVRTAANTATGKTKAKVRSIEATLNDDINEVVTELAQDQICPDRKLLLMHKLDDLRRLKRALVDKIGSRLQHRSARKWYNEGELSNKYFFNLLNRRANNDIETVIDSNGLEKSEPAEVENEIRSFYKNLYEEPQDRLVPSDDFFRHIEPVPQDQAATLEAGLTLQELTATLNTCSDSAPGPDGIPYSFLKHFWSSFGPVLLGAWQYSLTTAQLPPSHKVSYLRLIPKVGKDTRIVSNLRPITLSNTDHKLITKTYARKMTALVADRIGEEQTAYIPGRLINDNIRAMLSTIDLANVDANVDGVVVSLDAKKAFDSVDHDYIRRCLKEFGLSGFIPIFNVLYKGLNSQIIINGQAVNGFDICRGVKQGDALSCILFIMCIEPLIRNLKANPGIENIVSSLLDINIPKTYGFADDVAILTRNNPNGIQQIFNEYDAFSENSGLRLNADKTEILCFNTRRNFDQRFNIVYGGARYTLVATESVKINGIVLLQDPARRENTNVRMALEAMGRLLQAWSTRRLTLLGKILIIKTFAISKIIYLMQSMSLSEPSYKEIIKVIFKYLWNKNWNAAKAPERISRNIMLTPVAQGGFGMVSIRDLGESLDLRSFGRLQVTKHPFLSQVRALLNDSNPFEVTIEANVDDKLKKSLSLLNIRRKSIFKWPTMMLTKNVMFVDLVSNLKISNLLSAVGRGSLQYFLIHRRAPNPDVKHLTVAEFQSIRRFVLYPELSQVINELLINPPGIGVATEFAKNFYPKRRGILVNVSTLSSKDFRIKESYDDQLICIYKLGLILNPGEVKCWTKKLKRLTSTRHRNILLRLVHGDIFSNSRLFRFGLATDPKCLNCSEPSETIAHRISSCPEAQKAWQELERLKVEIGLVPLTDLSIDNLVGAKDNLGKLELTLQAELLHRLTSSNKINCPYRLVRAVVKFIYLSEKIDPEQRTGFERYLSN